DSVVLVVVRNVIGHNIGFWFWLLGRLPYTCLYWFGWIYSRNPSHQSTSRGDFSAVPALRLLLFDACLCENAALRRRPGAAFELTKHGQSPTHSLSAASAALARELISCRNCGGCPLNSPSAMKLFITPVASSCPGPVGRMIAQGGSFGLMNSHGSGMIRLACNVSG